ncbi:hypothetical protein ZHAS_00011399 [Anopheles sinensis]|uniref:Uncharacterized protein n=1 Tax=Anopheles sinensis TaxID=74873 RepID=A0A084W0C8_ANOSI|nr:hypothetical protein ZHAS_00011399 [Anopheles sinensis]
MTTNFGNLNKNLNQRHIQNRKSHQPGKHPHRICPHNRNRRNRNQNLRRTSLLMKPSNRSKRNNGQSGRRKTPNL